MRPNPDTHWPGETELDERWRESAAFYTFNVVGFSDTDKGRKYAKGAATLNVLGVDYRHALVRAKRMSGGAVLVPVNPV